MLNDVYNARILELAGNIPRLGRLPAPDASATAHSKLCGSTVTVDLKVADGAVSDFAHDVKACALGQASSSIMARHVIGAKPDELRALRETVRKMLKENGPPPGGEWYDAIALRVSAWLADTDADPGDRLVIMHGMSSRVLRGVMTGRDALPQFGAPVARDLPQGSVALIERGEETLVHLGTGRSAAPA